MILFIYFSYINKIYYFYNICIIFLYVNKLMYFKEGMVFCIMKMICFINVVEVNK